MSQLSSAAGSSSSSSSPRRRLTNRGLISGGGGGVSSPAPGGRLVQRLEEQEREIAQLKERCTQLTEHCQGMERWKQLIIIWIRDQFGENFGNELDLNEQEELDTEIVEGEEINGHVQHEEQEEENGMSSQDIVIPSIIKVSGGGDSDQSGSKSPLTKRAKLSTSSDNDLFCQTTTTTSPSSSSKVILSTQDTVQLLNGSSAIGCDVEMTEEVAVSAVTAVVLPNQSDEYIQLLPNPFSSGQREGHTSPIASTSQALVPSPDLGGLIDPEAPCDVCGGKEAEDGNTIIFCDKCDLAVHQACYGVPVIPKETEKWYCNPCEKDGLHTATLSCRLCFSKGGALKPILSPAMNTWGHVWCAWWVPETKMKSRSRQEPIIGISQISEKRKRLKCLFCNKKNGACIQCSYKQCAASFHPMCGKTEGLRMDMNDKGGDSPLVFKAYCAKHRHVSC